MNHSNFPSFVKGISLTPVLMVFFCFYATTFGQIEKKPCPELEIQMPSRLLTDRENFTFTLNAKDGTSLENVTVRWTVSVGKLINDNSSQTVTFTSSRDLEGQSVKITAIVEDFPKGCRVIVSNTFGIQQRPPIELWDEWGKQSSNDVKARLDNLFNLLTKQLPTYEGILIMSFQNKATRKYKIDQIKKILKAISFRGYDPKRLSIYFDVKANYETTKVFTFAPGFDYSEIEVDETKLIKVEEIPARLNTLFK